MIEGGGELSAIVREELAEPGPAGVRALCAAMKERLGDSLRAVLFYGSNRRSGTDTEGVLDFYAFVDRYERCFDSKLAVVLNKLLPPNVFYLEAEFEGRTVRCKYAVVEIGAFHYLTSPRRFETYFWARFAQPCSLVYAASEADAEIVVQSVAGAIVTVVRHGFELEPHPDSIRDLWSKVLRETYRTEVRTERAGAPRLLYDFYPQRYDRVTLAALPLLPFPVRSIESPAGPRLEAAVPAEVVRRVPFWWGLRRWVGKPVFIIRLLRNALYFEGGVEYVLWKIERHTGIRGDRSWRQKRFPILALLAEAWRLFRAGAFR